MQQLAYTWGSLTTRLTVHANITFFPFSAKQPTEQAPALCAIGLCLLHVHWKDADCQSLPLPSTSASHHNLTASITLSQCEVSSWRAYFWTKMRSHTPKVWSCRGGTEYISLIFSILPLNSLSDPALSHPSFSRMQLLLQWYWLPPRVFPFWLYLCNCSFVKSQGWNGIKYPEIFFPLLQCIPWPKPMSYTAAACFSTSLPHVSTSG